jgi:hypothetical protein
VLFIEAALLLEFLVFWLIQTVELWRRTTRDAPPVPPATPPAPPTATAAQHEPTPTV